MPASPVADAPHPWTCRPWRQALDKEAIHHEAKLVAFDRQNHMGVSEAVASRLEEAIVREAEALKKPAGATSVITIKDHEDRLKGLKVRGAAAASCVRLCVEVVGGGGGGPRVGVWLLLMLPPFCAIGLRNTLSPLALCRPGLLDALQGPRGAGGEGSQARHRHALPSERREAAHEGPDACAFHARAGRGAWKAHGPHHQGNVHQHQPARLPGGHRVGWVG